MGNVHVHEAHDVKKEVRIYLTVFAALAVLTIVTVAVSYLHLNVKAAVMLALCIATIKGSLVACYFMHLISEKKLIYSILILVGVFFVGLMFLPLAGKHDTLNGSTFVHPDQPVQTPPAHH